MKVIDADVCGLSFEDFLERYGNLIHKHSKHFINGLAEDDIYQELCIVALRCQKRFDPTHAAGAKFSTYLVNAMQRRVWSLAGRTNDRKHLWDQVPESVDSMPDHSGMFADPAAEVDFTNVDLGILLSRLSPGAKRVCLKILERRRFTGLAFRRSEKEAVEEITELLGQGYNLMSTEIGGRHERR